MPKSTFNPNWLSAPGDTIADLLEERGLSSADLAERVGSTIQETLGLLEGRTELTLDMASRLAELFGVPASFWMRREDLYRSQVSRLQIDQPDASASEWVRQLPLKSMMEFGWLQMRPGDDPFEACLRFFGTPTLDTWRVTYRDLLKGVAFRTSRAYASRPAAVAAWLRQGELESASLACRPWDPQRFGEALSSIRILTRRKRPAMFLPDLVRVCGDAGVAVCVVRAPEGCRASGATWFASPERAVLLLSVRYRTDEQFWFTFFHEAGHLVLHGSRTRFVEGLASQATLEETEANAFAGDTLIPPDHRGGMRRLGRDSREIIAFARAVGVAPGIVVGQLQHHGKIRRNQLNRLKRRYEWDS